MPTASQSERHYGNAIDPEIGAKSTESHAQASASDAIFDSWSERINLWFPLPFLLIGAWDVAMGLHLSNRDKDILDFAVRLIFLNYTHVLFTLPILAFCASGHEWLRSIFVESRIGYRYAGTFVLGMVALFFLRYTPTALAGHGVLVFVLINQAYNIYHNYKQSFGMSLLYNMVRGERMREAVEPRFVRWERSILNLSLFLLLVSIPLQHVSLGSPHIRSAVFTSLFGCTLVLSLMMVFLACCQSDFKMSNKITYSLRFMLYPLAIYSIPCMFAIQAMHGVEYLFIALRLVAPDWPRRKKVFAASALLIVMISTMRFPFLGLTSAWSRTLLHNNFWTINFFFVLTVTLKILHQVLDGLMFKARNPLNRKLFLRPLIHSP